MSERDCVQSLLTELNGREVLTELLVQDLDEWGEAVGRAGSIAASFDAGGCYVRLGT
jgi:hypothetical protein